MALTEQILAICPNHVTGHGKCQLTDHTQLQGGREATACILTGHHIMDRWQQAQTAPGVRPSKETAGGQGQREGARRADESPA